LNQFSDQLHLIVSVSIFHPWTKQIIADMALSKTNIAVLFLVGFVNYLEWAVVMTLIYPYILSVSIYFFLWFRMYSICSFKYLLLVKLICHIFLGTAKALASNMYEEHPRSSKAWKARMVVRTVTQGKPSVNQASTILVNASLYFICSQVVEELPMASLAPTPVENLAQSSCPTTELHAWLEWCHPRSVRTTTNNTSPCLPVMLTKALNNNYTVTNIVFFLAILSS